MTSANAKICIIEDDEDLRALLFEELEAEQYLVKTYSSIEQFLESEEAPDLIISDIRLPGKSGLSLLEDATAKKTDSAVLFITAFSSVELAVEALKMGADDFLTKPLDINHLLLCVEKILSTRSLKQELKQYQKKQMNVAGIIGSSPAMRKLYRQIENIGPTDGNVLITGESGTGKELVAKAIHQLSERPEANFHAVNCAGIPPDLMESEFFGHSSGAFTGAQKKRQGLFRHANGGTLLLDEIGEMPMALQAKLLRVLQEGTIRAVGSDKEERVDVRILAATHQNLEQLVAQGRFRQDLFYRLETFMLAIPPLRERGEDLERLASFFLSQLREKNRKPIYNIEPEALDALYAYPFPGNVRELENALERAYAFSDSSGISMEALPERIWSAHNEQPPTTTQWPTLTQHQDAYVRKVLRHCQGNKSKAAEILNITRRTLYRWLEQQSSHSE